MFKALFGVEHVYMGFWRYGVSIYKQQIMNFGLQNGWDTLPGNMLIDRNHVYYLFAILGEEDEPSDKQTWILWHTKQISYQRHHEVIQAGAESILC